MATPDYHRLTADELPGRKCVDCGNPAVYATVAGTRLNRCTNHTARWAAENGLPFPKDCKVEVRQ